MKQRKIHNWKVTFRLADGRELTEEQFKNFEIDCSKEENQLVLENLLYICSNEFTEKRALQQKINENNKRKQKVLQQLVKA